MFTLWALLILTLFLFMVVGGIRGVVSMLRRKPAAAPAAPAPMVRVRVVVHIDDD